MTNRDEIGNIVTGGSGLTTADGALLSLRSIVVQEITSAMHSDAMTNGGKLRFVHAVSASDLFQRPTRAAEYLEGLGDALQQMGDAETERYHRAADAFAKFGALAEKSKMFIGGRLYPALTESANGENDGNETISPKDVAA